MTRRRTQDAALRCPRCGHVGRLRVLDTRVSAAGDCIHRRRVCGGCGARYSTVECVEAPAADLHAQDVYEARLLMGPSLEVRR